MKKNERIESISSLFKSTLKKITASAENYTEFLTFASRNYKYAYHQQLLFFAQKPNATAIATYDVWSNIGNPVKYGSTAIWGFNLEMTSTQYFFDIASTVHPERFQPWKSVKEDYKSGVITGLKQSIEGELPVSVKCENINISLENSVIQYAQELLNKKLSVGNAPRENEEFIIRAIQFGICQRIGIPAHINLDEFNCVSHMTETQFTHVQAATSEITGKVLKLIEQNIKQLEREKYYEIENNQRSEAFALRGNAEVYASAKDGEWKNASFRRGNHDVSGEGNNATTANGNVRSATTNIAGGELLRLFDGANNDDAVKRISDTEEQGIREPLSNNIRAVKESQSANKYPEFSNSLAVELRTRDTGKGTGDAGNERGNSGLQQSKQNIGLETALSNEGSAVSQVLATTISVLVVEPQKEPYQKEIEQGYKALQEIIEGNFTTTEIDVGVDIISSDEYPREPVVNRIVKGFPFYETFIIAGVDYESGKRISLTTEQLEKYSKQFETPIFEIPQSIKENTANSHNEIVEKVLLKGGNVKDSTKRIYNFFRTNSNQNERAKFLKNEYGTGGSYRRIGEDGHFDQSHDSKGIIIDYKDDTIQFIDKITWEQASKKIDRLVNQGRYPIPSDWIEQEAITTASRDNRFTELPSSADFKQISLFDVQEYSNEIKASEEPALSYLNSGAEDVIEARQIGDFYEILGDNAETASKILKLSLTKKKLPSGDIVPMVGIPSNHLEGYNRKLRSNGKSIAVTTTDVVVSPKASIPKGSNYIFPQDFALPNGQKSKYKCNIEAIKLLKELEKESRLATPKEQEVLAHYAGWGGIPQAFDEGNKAWGKEYAELGNLLSDDEYICARASVNNAHFTTPLVIKEIYNALSRFGFESGNVFEPALGIGNFYGAMPNEMKSSKLYSTEIDNITGRIAKQLYPNAEIQIAGFETVEYPENFMDIGIGNVPFGDYSPFDPKYNNLHLNIHDYFFAKSLDVVRPNGILAFITSKGTLDKANPTFRKYLAQRAELLGAIRLPNTAFKQNANTEVTSDIIFLKRRELLTVDEPDWVHLGQTEDGVPANLYYIQNPQMMLGKMVYDSMYGGTDRRETALQPDDRELGAALKEAVSFLPIGAYKSQEYKQERVVQDVLPASPSVKNFTYTVDNGFVYYRENATMFYQELKHTNELLIKDFCKLKNCIRNLLDIQKDGCNDAELAAAQKELNGVYDKFVLEHDHVTKKANYKLLKKDVDYFLVSSLENVDSETGEVTKRDIFTKRTISPKYIITSAGSAKDALSISLSEKGLIDFKYMQSIYDVSFEEIVEELGSLIYLNPEKYNSNEPTTGYETESEYLSGYVRDKLQAAQTAAQEQPELFLKNVEALEKVQPEDIPAEDIEIHLGSNFISIDYYNQFIYETLKPSRKHQVSDPRNGIFLQYNKFNNSYFIANKGFEARSVLAKDTFGTERMSAYHIIENCLNLQSAVVKDNVAEYGEKPCYVLNPTETAVAKQKQELLQDSFKEWVFSDAARRKDIVRIYNDKFNNVRLREYDGSLLQNIEGMSPEWHLRPKQADAVARGIFSGKNALFAHCVGAGKTLTCATVIMERKRLGLSKKAMIVVPNTLTDQWEKAFLDYFPAANILVSTKDDFEKGNRRTFVSKIATGDYDAVILGFSQFEKIPVSDTLMTREIKDQIENVTECIRQIKSENGERWTVKQAEGEKKKLETQLKKLMDTSKKDNVISFEELGVDSLFVDEAHNYKNCAIFTKLRNVAGVGNKGAKKSTDLLLKCKYLSEINNNKGGVYFATGTPLSNSMAEMFTMERYLMNDELQRMGFDYFDNWVSVFGETVTSMELKPEGNGYRPRTRLSRFVNLPELMTAFRMVADIQTADMLDLPKPKLVGGKAQVLVANPSPALLDFLTVATKRADRIRNNEVDSRLDNMLKLTGDARRAGTDMRLIDTALSDYSFSKINICVEKVIEVFNQTAAVRGVQLVFCDISTPNPQKFNVYDDMKAKWIAAGIPAEQIAFIHNANNEIQLARLFSQLRTGQVRILVGSSAKCGAGMNVQDRLVALHHVDAPWTPKDIEQREGRILRPGNKNEEVLIVRYVTEKSFDSYMWGIIENKQRFISQIMTSKTLVRSCEDVDETVLSYAEIKAIANGNPKIKEKMEVDLELLKIRVLKNEYSKKHFKLQDEFEIKYPQSIANNITQINRFQGDIETRNKNTVKDFTIIINGKVFTDKEKAGELLIKLSSKALANVGTYRGFKLEVASDFGEPYIRICGNYKYRTDVSDSGIGMIQRIDNSLNCIEKQIAKLESENLQNQDYIEQSKREYEKPFEKEVQLKELQERQISLEKELQLDQKATNETPWTEQDIETVEDEYEDELEEDYELEE